MPVCPFRKWVGEISAGCQQRETMVRADPKSAIEIRPMH